MKKILILSVLAMLAMFMALPATAQETVSGAGFGLFLQDGETGTFNYSVGLQVPVVTRDSSGYYIIIDPDIVYSNRPIGFEDGTSLKEIQGLRGFVTGAKKTYLGIYANLGIGGYVFVNTDGGDKKLLAYRFGISGKPVGFYTFAGIDIVDVAGPDLYNINIAIRLLKI